MIIKTIYDLYPCMDDGVGLECENWMPAQTGADRKWWCADDFKHHMMRAILELIQEGRIRTKPRTVDVVLFFNDDERKGEPCGVELRKGFRGTMGLTASTHTIPLDGE